MEANLIRTPLSRTLLMAILSDFVSDRFVAKLIWERLNYEASNSAPNIWVATNKTPLDWSYAFPIAPEIISQRSASVYLTRSIPKENKQLLKQSLSFSGYSIGELYPRRTRRATAVNWLLSWLALHGESLPEKGPMPELNEPPLDPIAGHLGDPEVK